MTKITKCKPQRLPLKSNMLRKSDRKPINKAKNNVICDDCDHEERFHVNAFRDNRAVKVCLFGKCNCRKEIAQ